MKSAGKERVVRKSDRPAGGGQYHFDPGTMQEVEAWLMEVGFDVNAVWCNRDLAVYGCRK